jgi:hypothetical protein
MDGEVDGRIAGPIDRERDGKNVGENDGENDGEIEGAIEGAMSEVALSDDSELEDDAEACIAVEPGANAGSCQLGVSMAIRFVAGDSFEDVAICTGCP